MPTFFIGSVEIQNGDITELKGYVISIDKYTNNLRKQWNSIVVKSLQNPLYSLEWTYKTDDLMYLSRDQKFVIIEKMTIDYLAEFCTWYRLYVPKEVSLTLFDEGLNITIPLTPKLTERKLRDLLK